MKRAASISPPAIVRKRRHESSVVVDLGETDPGDGWPSFRIYSWNINGITPFLQRPITTFFSGARAASEELAVASASLRNFLRRHKWPEILGLQEIKIANSDKATQAAVRRAVNKREKDEPIGDESQSPDYEVYFTLPTSRYNARGWGGKVYGVCSIIRSDFTAKHVSRVRTVDWDDEGRFGVIELKDKTVIWNVYAVNGTENPYRDTLTGETRGTRHDRKVRVHQLLYDECIAMQAANSETTHIIIGDLNIAPARIDGHPNLRTFPQQHVENRADFHSKFLNEENSFRGVDVWRRLYPDEKRYTYHGRGVPWGSSCDRVDLAVVSGDAVDEDRVVDARIFDSVQERGPSDHVPISVEVRFAMAGIRVYPLKRHVKA